MIARHGKILFYAGLLIAADVYGAVRTDISANGVSFTVEGLCRGVGGKTYSPGTVYKSIPKDAIGISVIPPVESKSGMNLCRIALHDLYREKRYEIVLQSKYPDAYSTVQLKTDDSNTLKSVSAQAGNRARDPARDIAPLVRIEGSDSVDVFLRGQKTLLNPSLIIWTYSTPDHKELTSDSMQMVCGEFEAESVLPGVGYLKGGCFKLDEAGNITAIHGKYSPYSELYNPAADPRNKRELLTKFLIHFPNISFIDRNTYRASVYIYPGLSSNQMNEVRGIQSESYLDKFEKNWLKFRFSDPLVRITSQGPRFEFRQCKNLLPVRDQTIPRQVEYSPLTVRLNGQGRSRLGKGSIFIPAFDLGWENQPEGVRVCLDHDGVYFE